MEELLKRIMELPILERMDLITEVILSISKEYEALSAGQKDELEARHKALEDGKTGKRNWEEVQDELNKWYGIDN